MSMLRSSAFSASDLLFEFERTLLDWIGLDKQLLRGALINTGHPELFQAFAHLANYKNVLFVLLPILVLQRLFPARATEGLAPKNLVFDWLYPVYQLLLMSMGLTWAVLAINDFYVRYLPGANKELLSSLPFALQFIAIFLVQDFFRYVSHFVRHKVRWFWYFHAIHHSQVRLNPASNFRTHPVEAVISTAVNSIPIGLIGGEPSAWILGGVTSLAWDLFIHGNVRTNLGFLGRFIASPQNHRVHHSIEPQHKDCNFGDRLLLWDQVFGTLSRDRVSYPATGVEGTEHILETGLNPIDFVAAWTSQTIYPFGMIYRDVLASIASARVGRTRICRFYRVGKAEVAQRQERHS